MTSGSESDCDFCGVIANEESAREVLHTKDVVAFFPLEPATLGHTLLVPRQHLPDIWHLVETTAALLASATLNLSRAIRDALSPDGLNIIQSDGEAATQTVPHLHVHLVPRWHGDAMGAIWPEQGVGRHLDDTSNDTT